MRRLAVQKGLTTYMVKKHYADGQTDYEMKDEVLEDLRAYKSWYNFDKLGQVVKRERCSRMVCGTAIRGKTPPKRGVVT